MHRFFVEKNQIPIITGPNAHHIRNVLRMHVGDKLELLDGSGKIWEVQIKAVQKEKISCEIISSHNTMSEPQIKITIAQSLPKAAKMDFIIQKCTELGADKIIPMLTERWQRIAKEAAEQSGRAIVPKVCPELSFEEILKTGKDYNLALIPWELETSKSLKSILKPLIHAPSPHLAPSRTEGLSILILIGPEGGFSEKEINSAIEQGFTPVTLGKRVLRTETAAMATLAMITYEMEQT